MNSMGIEWPKRLLFIGSGITKTPSGWLDIPSIRTNARTIGKFKPNKIFGIMTWPTNRFEGLGGVLDACDRERIDPYIWIFNQKQYNIDKGPWYHPIPNNEKIFMIPVAERYGEDAFQDFVCLSKGFGYEPRNTTGFYMILWLLYANVDEIYISGYDGWMALTGLEPRKWDVSKPYYDIDGNEWCAADNEKIRRGQTGNFYFHNLTVEWMAIEKAIEKARARGVRVEVSKEA